MLYWYKYNSHFGPGHQSDETSYFFTQSELSEEWLEEYALEEARRISQLYDCQCVTNVERVDQISAEVLTEKRQDAIRMIENGIAYLKLLHTKN